MATALEQGLLLNVTSGNVVRLLPPLNLSQSEADQIIETVSALIEALG
jgi:acetylornithine aminotransferase